MATGLQRTSGRCNRRSCCQCPGNSMQEWIASVSWPDWVSRLRSITSLAYAQQTNVTTRSNSHNIKFLRQSTRITGFGNETFEKLTTDIARIQAIFKRAIGPQLQDEAGLSQYDGFTAIDASNRYFTLRTDRNQNEECMITDEMDPRGYLRKAAGNTFIHTEENKVHYFEMREDNAGESR